MVALRSSRHRMVSSSRILSDVLAGRWIRQDVLPAAGASPLRLLHSVSARTLRITGRPAEKECHEFARYDYSPADTPSCLDAACERPGSLLPVTPQLSFGIAMPFRAIFGNLLLREGIIHVSMHSSNQSSLI